MKQLVIAMLLIAPVGLGVEQQSCLFADEGSDPPPIVLTRVRALASIPQQSEPGVMQKLLRILSLRDYNTRLVLLGTTLVGATAGVVGTFMLLRRRSLVGDVVGHSALPGIAGAFLIMEMLYPGTGRTLPALLAGAFVAGLFSALCVILIDRYTRLKADAAMAIVLSVFYGLGAALFTVVQRVPSGNAAGLKTFLNGKAASLVAGDIWLFLAAAVVVASTMMLLKELTLLCFDDEFAKAEGWPVFWMDALLIGLVVAVTIIGMQSVGLILVVATLITPPASARFWTDDIRIMILLAAVFGGMSAFVGTVLSALFPRVAAGAVIVLVGAALFAVSLCCGQRRGILVEQVRLLRSRRQTGRLDLLRAIYEFMEASAGRRPELSQVTQVPMCADDLVPLRCWNRQTVMPLLRAATREGLLTNVRDQWFLTSAGAGASQQVARNHRLWEMYLMKYADIAPSHVDRDADLIEHVLDAKLIGELERELNESSMPMPTSSHVIGVEE